MALVVSCLVEKFGTPMGPKVPMIALQSGGENKNSLCIRAFMRLMRDVCFGFSLFLKALSIFNVPSTKPEQFELFDLSKAVVKAEQEKRMH